MAQYQSEMSSTWLAMGARVISSQGATAVIHGCSFVHWAYGEKGVTDCNAEWGVGDVWGTGCSSTFAVRMLNL